MDKNPKMKMMAFPMEIWKLHRRIHHRFLKYWSCFSRATDNLPQISGDAAGSVSDDSDVEPADDDDGAIGPPIAENHHVIDLLTTDSEDEEEGKDEDEEEGKDDSGDAETEHDDDTHPSTTDVEKEFDPFGSSSENEAQV